MSLSAAKPPSGWNGHAKRCFSHKSWKRPASLPGGIAHDFNNLLGVVVSGMELLAREIHSDSGRKALESMRRASARGATDTATVTVCAQAAAAQEQAQRQQGTHQL
jgi:hypothetical protein